MNRLIVCADLFPPYQYRLDDGTDTGLDYNIVINALQEAGYETDFVLGQWDEVIALFESGQADALFQVQDTPERLEKYYLSDKLRDAVTEIVTKDEQLTDLGTYDELAGFRLGVIAGFANGEEIDRLPQSCKKSYPDTALLLAGLDEGEIDAAVCDHGVRCFVSDVADQYKVIGALTYKRPLYVMFHDRAVRDAFNEAFGRKEPI